MDVNRTGYILCIIATTITVGAAVGYSVSVGNAALSVIAVVAGIVLLKLLKSRVSEVIEDERTHRIGEKASRKTLQVFGLTIAASVP
jgi:uncharacterized membrane protein